MTRTAMVVEATADSIKIKNDDIPSAKAATSRRFWGVRERAYAASNPQDFPLTPGLTVEIYLPPGRTIASSALIFLLPLALFPVGLMLAGILIPGSGEGLGFLFGMAALFLGFPLGALIRRIFGGLGTVPEILRVLDPLEARNCASKASGCGSCTLCG